MKPEASLLSALLSLAVDIRQSSSSFKRSVEKYWRRRWPVEGQLQRGASGEGESEGFRRGLVAAEDVYHAHVWSCAQNGLLSGCPKPH